MFIVENYSELHLKLYHTLKTLFEHTKKHYPELINQFKELENYCVKNSGNKNTGYNSLKWIIYTLRDHLTPIEIENTFYFLLAECQNREEDLYTNIKKTKTYFLNRNILQKQRETDEKLDRN